MQRRVRRCVASPLQSGRARPPTRKLDPSQCISDVPMDLPAVSTDFVKRVTPPELWTSAPFNVVASKIAASVPPRPPPRTSRTFSDPHINSVSLISESMELNQAQRQTCYDTLSRVLGPAHGIQECVGTYSAYMARQTEVYYEQLLSYDCPPSATVEDPSSLQPDNSQTGDTSTEDTFDYFGSAYAYSPDSLLDLANAVLTSGDFDNSFASSASDSVMSLELDDILASPIIQEDAYPEPPPSKPAPPPKSVSFAPVNRALLNYSALLLSARKGTVAGQSSSSLAGALDELPSPPISKTEQETARRSREWTRPRMGRARAYSAGGGM